MISHPPARSPGALLFFALLGVTLVVAALVVRARTPDLALEVVELSPRELTLSEAAGGGGTRIAFFVRLEEPRAEVSIVDPEPRTVRTLDPAVALEQGRIESYRWDGRTDAGHPAPPGRYRLRVRLPEHDRDMIWPRAIILERAP